MKCPSCQQLITHVDLERGPLGGQAFGPLVAGYTAVCPRCRAVVGVMNDADAIAKKVVDALTKRR